MVSRALQRGHCASHRHDAHTSDGAKPRRFTNTSDCSPRASRIADRFAHLVADAVLRARGAVRRQPDARRRRARIGARGQVEAAVAAFARVQPGLERRRRAAQHDRHAAAVCAPDGGVARVVTDAVLLLVRRVLLLVDDDESQRGHRREDREPRAEDEPGVARGRGVPRRAALAGGQAAVQRRDGQSRQRVAHARDELRRQVDLGHQHQHLAAAREHRRRCGQVHVGLAAAGDAVQQERRERAVRLRDFIHRATLRVVERVRSAGRVSVRGRRAHDEALLAPRAQRALLPGRQRRGVGSRQRPLPEREPCEQRACRGRARHALRQRLRARGRELPRRDDLAARAAPAAAGGRHREPQRKPERLLVVRRDEFREREHVLGQRRHGKDVGDRMELLRRDRRVVSDRDDDAGRPCACPASRERCGPARRRDLRAPSSRTSSRRRPAALRAQWASCVRRGCRHVRKTASCSVRSPHSEPQLCSPSPSFIRGEKTTHNRCV